MGGRGNRSCSVCDFRTTRPQVSPDSVDLASWFDKSCMLAGVLNLVVQKVRKSCRWLDLRALAPEMFNGAAVPPFLLLILGASTFPELLALVEKVSKPTLFLAGLVALWAVLDISFGEANKPKST